MPRTKLRLAVALIVTLPVAAQNPTNTLCSNVTSVIGYGQIVCTFPGQQVSQGVSFTVGQWYQTPFTNSPLQYERLAQIDDSGSGICLIPTMDPLGPSGDYTLDLRGSGDDFSTYTHVWQGIVHEWGWFPYPLAPVTWTHYTMEVTASAYACRNEEEGCADPGTCEADEFWSPQYCMCSPRSNSPILLDLGSGSYELVGPNDGVWFDIAANGTPIKLGWTPPAAPVAFLALDRNGNGRIDNGAELFGNYTPVGSAIAANGFQALAFFDAFINGGNEDRMIDERDDVYSRLLLWIDFNHDAISTSSELFRLATFQIRSIGLDARNEMRRDKYANLFRYRSTFVINEHRRPTYDVYFSTSGSVAGCVNSQASWPSDR